MTSAAETILEAFSSRQLIGLLTDADPRLDQNGAYEIAREAHDRRVRLGENPVGRKIGFTNRAGWAEYGVRAPIWGYCYDSTLSYAEDAQASLRIGHLLQPRIEPEIQLHFARTPPVTGDEGTILACVDWIAQGFEIVQCPFPDWGFRAADAIAALALHGALVVGPRIAVSDVEDCADRLASFTISLARNGVAQASGSGANVLDSPILAFARLAEVLAEQPEFEPVRAGEIVTTGTLTTPQPIAPGETWSTTLDGIDLPGLSITFD
jgi:2-keto-4-pentenoate hydratase